MKKKKTKNKPRTIFSFVQIKRYIIYPSGVDLKLNRNRELGFLQS